MTSFLGKLFGKKAAPQEEVITVKKESYESEEMRDKRMRMTKEERYKSAIMGFVVGDALGVPVEFRKRYQLAEDPVIGMREKGTHNQEIGTWSDDSSMVVATMEWLSENTEKPTEYTELMKKFLRWYTKGDYTAGGKTFDVGEATQRAISQFENGVEPKFCGGTSEYDNGNGSLMRMLPLALWDSEELAWECNEGASFVFDVSALTHAHARSKAGCFIYSKIIANLLHMPEKTKMEVVEESIQNCVDYFQTQSDSQILRESGSYERLWDVDRFKNLPTDKIQSGGYIVHTLEAAIWCFLNTNDYKECVLEAVNLGGDTDTVAAVAGGMAGLYYGFEEIPQEWVKVIRRGNWIMELAGKLAQSKP